LAAEVNSIIALLCLDFGAHHSFVLTIDTDIDTCTATQPKQIAVARAELEGATEIAGVCAPNVFRMFDDGVHLFVRNDRS
jgi:hypothetical protein